jgi:hypothetical protein
MTRAKLFALALGALLLLPAGASAQSSFVGVVTDNTGGVLPGATVEVASPVLIEKVRTAVTDGQGRYTITQLRPGTYTITFSLAGFGTVRREGVVLPSDFTATVSVQLGVGTLEETVTVSGQTPLVDVQSAARTVVIDRELLDSLPTPRNTQSFGYLAPGVRLSRPDVGGAQQMEQVNMRVHGASQLHTTMQIDGMLVSPSFSDGAIQNYMNQAHFGETAFTTSSQGAEVSAGGVRLNMIPRDGGNIFSGTIYAGATEKQFQSDNLTPELIAQGVTLPTGIDHVRDINPSYGGPVKRDRLWFYMSTRYVSVNEHAVNSYMPDGSVAVVDQYVSMVLGRLTAQLTPKMKLSGFVDRVFKFKGREFGQTAEPSRASTRRNWGGGNYSTSGSKFTSTVSSRILFEAGYTQILERLRHGYQPHLFSPPAQLGPPRPAVLQLYTTTTDPFFTIIRHTELEPARGTPANTVATGGASRTLPDRYVLMSALSYVTGTHNIKGGWQWAWGQDRSNNLTNGDISAQQYRRGIPESVVVTQNPLFTDEYVKGDMGFYIQDTWTLKRLTISPGVRYEDFTAYIQEQWSPPGRFVPGRWFPKIENLPRWRDVTPRFGLVYDVRGDGTTAVKFAANKYVRPMAGSFAQRYNPLRGGGSDTRDWFDVDLIPGTAIRSGVPKPTDRDDVVQDNEIGPSNSTSFGRSADRQPIDGISRELNYEYTVSVQHQLFSGLSVTGGWYRRNYDKLIGSDNTLLDPARDFTPFTVANPLTGEPLTIYNLNLNKRGQTSVLDYNSDVNTHISNDFEFSFNSRLPNGSTVFGNWSASKNVAVTCDQDDPNGSDQSDLYYAITFLRGGRWCDQRLLPIPYRHDFKLAGTLPLRYGIELSGTVVSFAGNELQATWNVPASEFPNRQRTQTTTVQLIPPGTKYLDRWNQVDFAVKKSFRAGRVTYSTQMDLYNALNSSVVITRNTSYGPSLDFPTAIIQARLMRLVAQIKW